MRLVIDFRGESKKNLSKRDFDRAWRYTIASSVVVIAIAIPQISSWVESQLLVKSLQSLIGIPNTTITNMTSSITGQIAFPTAQGIPVTSEFGWRKHPITGERRFHTGIDFGATLGTPIYAVDTGSIELAGFKGGYGKTVIVNHGGGKSTLYGHASSLYVRQGQKVVRGQMVAAIGSTGVSRGPHLHFEVRINNKPVNPRPYLWQHLAKR
ncbi:MAG: M23 family metallopeptidase [Heteroscytonema crispum UTEX LB 1556]